MCVCVCCFVVAAAFSVTNWCCGTYQYNTPPALQQQLQEEEEERHALITAGGCLVMNCS